MEKGLSGQGGWCVLRENIKWNALAYKIPISASDVYILMGRAQVAGMEAQAPVYG